MKFCFFDFRVSDIFLFSVSFNKSDLLKMIISFAFAFFRNCSDCFSCSTLFMTRRRVSVVFIRDWSVFGNGGRSMIWIFVFS